MKANTSDDLANYLDLTFIIESKNRLYTKLYDKRDDCDFHIVNFPLFSSNIPSSPSYGVYISQLIRYPRCCSCYDDFGYRHKLLVDRLLSQGYEAKRLRNSFKKLYGRYPDLTGKHQRSVKDMVADSFPDQLNAVVQLVLSFLYSLNFINDFVTWIVTFYQLMLVVTGVMHEADNTYSIWSTWLCYRLVRFLITAYIC